MSSENSESNVEEAMEFPTPSAPLKRYISSPPTYNEWMDEIAERTRAWFARPIESRPPRRQPVPERFVMED